MAGDFLRKYFTEHMLTTGTAGSFIPKILLWHSPYQRTRQTTAEIEKTCTLPKDVQILDRPTPPDVFEVRVKEKRKAGDSFFFDKREHMLLAEQQFGVFDGLSDEERKKHYPREQAYYEKCKKFEGKLWPKMPLGESRFEVCQRVHQSFGTFHRDAERHGIHDIVIVGHGTTNRAFVQMWLHHPWEWMHQEPNPLNCSIRLIQDGVDEGYVFKGFKGGQHAGQ